MHKLDAPLPTASRSLLADHAYDVLRSAILSSELAAGTPLRETELATRIGVSRTPIREALRRLTLEGLATRTTLGGVIVSEITTQLITESFALRKLLEGYAAREAAKVVGPPDIARLEAIIAESQRMIAEQQFERLPELNDQFHGYIEELAHNTLLTRTTRSLREQTVAYRAFALGEPDQQRGFVEGHKTILSALAAHNPELAETLAVEHLDYAAQLLLSRTPEQ